MRRLDASDPGFAAEFDALVNDRRESASDVSADVAAIVARVKAEGDAALADYTARFDRFDLDASGWSISKEECAAAYEGLAPDLRAALRARGVGADPMSTGAAVRTYNVLLAEERRVAAALVAVD